MKKVKILVFLAITLFPAIAFALELEVGFPQVGGFSPGSSASPEDWIRYIYLLSMALVGLALVYTFARAGIEWMFGGANPGQITAAKKRMQEGIIGLLILLGSYVFLREINPQLVSLKTPRIEVNSSGGDLLDFLGVLVRDNSEYTFEGYEAGHTCSADTDCGKDLACNEEGKCVEGEKSSSIETCSNTKLCPNGQRCFDNANTSRLAAGGAQNIPYTGTCSDLRAFDEPCDKNVATACRGNGMWCNPTTEKCSKMSGTQ
jgi:hypothetical protein